MPLFADSGQRLATSVDDDRRSSPRSGLSPPPRTELDAGIVPRSGSKAHCERRFLLEDPMLAACFVRAQQPCLRMQFLRQATLSYPHGRVVT
jgi:hypothetical protein